MRTLVTGGTGFIGRHLVTRLEATGREVRTLCRNTHGTFSGNFGDRESCCAALKGVEEVIHLAWSTVPHSSEADPEADLRQNVAGSATLLECCVEAGVRHMTFLSTGGAIYGLPEQLPIREDHPLRPTSSYGLTKAAVEKLLIDSPLETVILRGANAYGPGQSIGKGQGVIGTWLDRIRSGKSIRIFGDGKVVRDYLFIDDLVDGIVRASSQAPDGSIVNLGAGVGHSLLNILEIVRAVTDRSVEVEFVEGRPFDVPVNRLDISRARTLLDWSPKVELEDGIRRTWNAQ